MRVLFEVPVRELRVVWKLNQSPALRVKYCCGAVNRRSKCKNLHLHSPAVYSGAFSGMSTSRFTKAIEVEVQVTGQRYRTPSGCSQLIGQYSNMAG